MALLPTWFLTNERRIEVVRSQIQPREIVAMHVPRRDAPAAYFDNGGYDASLRKMREQFPEVYIFEEHGVSATFERKSVAPAAANRPPAPGVRPAVSLDETQLAAGRFLVAKREMIDPNFAKTVVLLLDYGMHGSLGLVINRPSEMKISALLPELDELKQRKDTVWVGGPVPGNNMFMLVRSTEEPDESRLVFEDVYVSRSEELLGRLAKKRKSTFRVYAGYAGWAPGQLDHEVARGDWHIVQADGDVVFAENPGDIWPILIPPVPSQQARLRLDNFNKSATSPPLLGYYESRR